MWRDSHLPGIDLSIQEAAVCGAESLIIAITRSWATPIEEVESYLVNPLHV